MTIDDRKLAPNLVWLFALAALGVAIVIPKVVHVHTIKSGCILYALSFAVPAVAATLLTRAGTWLAATAFALAGVAHTVYWFVTARAHAGTGGVAMGLVTTFTAVFGLASIVGGVGGALFGQKVRRNLARTSAALSR
jgi:hypothetical protein